MPYIITTSEPFDAAVHTERPAFTRRAVATLDEARHIAWQTAGCGDDLRFAARAIDDALPDSGGTIGPLPDGTVIEVAPVSYEALTHEVGMTDVLPDGWTEQVIDAYNARTTA